MAQSKDPITAGLYEKRAGIAETAKFERLEPYKYHDMIDKFAQRYGLHPDSVYAHTSFDTISLFLSKWKEEMEADDRYHEIEKMIQAAANPPKNV
jgi:hypothetical protein